MLCFLLSLFYCHFKTIKWQGSGVDFLCVSRKHSTALSRYFRAGLSARTTHFFTMVAAFRADRSVRLTVPCREMVSCGSEAAWSHCQIYLLAACTRQQIASHQLGVWPARCLWISFPLGQNCLGTLVLGQKSYSLLGNFLTIMFPLKGSFSRHVGELYRCTQSRLKGHLTSIHISPAFFKGLLFVSNWNSTFPSLWL